MEISAHRYLHGNRDPSSSLAEAVTSKIEDGNLRAAIRMLSSDEQLAPFCEDTGFKLRSKHPEAPHDRHPFPPSSLFAPLQVTDEIVREAITSFSAGSAGGPNNFRPRHMLDLVNSGEEGGQLLSHLTAFVNLLLRGQCPPDIGKLLFGGKLVSLNKKDGGIRPIAVGYYWRRSVAKCANLYPHLKKCQTYLRPCSWAWGFLVGARPLNIRPVDLLRACRKTMFWSSLISRMHSIAYTETSCLTGWRR